MMLLLFIGVTTIAQIKFEKGYFISNNGIKTTCLIKNEGWVNTPQVFKYKLSENSVIETGTIQHITEFGFKQLIKFKRFTTKIDRASTSYSYYDKSRLSNFKSETLFLEVVIDGSNQLFQYKSESLTRFFFIKNNESIQPLEFKLYKKSNGIVYKNLNYQKQLKEQFPVSNYNYSNLRYTKNALTKYLVQYLNLNQVKFTQYLRGKNYQSTFNLKVKIKNSLSDLTFDNDLISNPLNLGKKNQVKVGFEIEWGLPFNNNKWGLFIEPTYQSYNANEKQNVNNSLNTLFEATIDYKSIEIPIGLRHYLFLNKNSKIFINSGFVIDVAFSSKTSLKHSNYGFSSTFPFVLAPKFHDSDITNSVNFFIGSGYGFSKFNIEFRYNTSRNLINSYTSAAKYSSFSIILGYQLF